MVKSIFFMCFLVLIYSCTSNLVKERANGEVTDVYVDVDDVIDELDFSLFLNDEAKFIKLETTDSCLISEMKQISYVDGKIYIADELSQSVYIFNDSGSFLKKIGVKGQGPGEYVRLGKFQVVGNYLYIKDDASPWKLYVYDLKSSVGRLMDIDENLSYDDFYLQGDNLYLVANNNSSYSYGCYNLLKLGMATNEMDCYLPFSENLAKQHSHWGLFSNISQYKDSLLIICSNNDTIYQSTKDGTSAKYAVHFSKRELPEDLRQKDGTTIMMTAMEKRYIKGLSSILNLDGYFIAQYGDYIMRSILYDKRTDEHTVANVLKLGKWGDLYMWEYSFSDDGKLIVADSGGAFLSSWKERYSNRTFIRSEDKKDLQKIYEQTSEEDNPIIGIFTLKNK